MAQLQKSIDKRTALLKATLQLVNNGGIQGASMAKIAKEASISPATIYLFFDSKQELLNQLYLSVKSNFAHAAFSSHAPGDTIPKQFETIWHNMAQYKLEHPEEASFLSQCDNTPMIDDQTRQEGLLFLTPLFDLWNEGISKGIIKNYSPYLLYAHSIYPMAFLMNINSKDLCTADENILNESFQMAWDSIKS
ncbi:MULTISPECIES: TetR/AcrR family transcriptional regulator [unclassified Flavobacterium]|uniref:TetR/AcrR family transcriptional regulator n=1 Tax=unclassified Flavobacterium TaxID=196869 RepID=UPI00131D2E3E|nr:MULTISPECIES: TetR/AcrR family transcriptional regulator [unclassified Flavobacterium]